MVLTKTRLLKHDFPVHGVRIHHPNQGTAPISTNNFSGLSWEWVGVKVVGGRG